MSRAEDIFQASCADYLRMRLHEPWRFFHVPNGFFVPGAKRDLVAREMAKLKRAGLSNGVPDIIIAGPRDAAEPMIWIELKTETGALSKEQRGWRDALKAMGWAWFLCRSLDEVEDALDASRVPARARLRPVRAQAS